MENAPQTSSSHPPGEILTRFGVRVWKPPKHTTLTVNLEQRDATPPPHSPDLEDQWRRLCALNPRLHDGPIIAVTSYDHAQHTLTCRLDSYKRLAVQQAAATGSEDPFRDSLVWLLGVKGWIVGKDRGGNEHLLIARRGPQTRIYGGMWEAAPGGGVTVPTTSPRTLAQSTLLETLSAESHEELGLSLDWSGASLLAIAQDSTARSYDLFHRLELPSPIDPRRSPVCTIEDHAWEYIDSAWLARDAEAFDRQAADAISPPTRAVLRAAGWINA